MVFYPKYLKQRHAALFQKR